MGPLFSEPKSIAKQPQFARAQLLSGSQPPDCAFRVLSFLPARTESPWNSTAIDSVQFGIYAHMYSRMEYTLYLLRIIHTILANLLFALV